MWMGVKERRAGSWWIPHAAWQGEWQPRQIGSWRRHSGSSHLPASPDLSVCPPQTSALIGEAWVRQPGGLLIGVSSLGCQLERGGYWIHQSCWQGTWGGGRSSQSAGENPAYGKAVKNNWFGLEQGDPLSQINDPQIPICASNCPKWWMINISPWSALSQSKESNRQFPTFFHSIFKCTWWHTTFCFSIIGHSVTIWEGENKLEFTEHLQCALCVHLHLSFNSSERWLWLFSKL